jgi:hypothetical protein
MPASGKVLEDSIRLSRIRRIKITLYAVQAVMLIALAFVVIFVFGKAHLKPTLYLPVDQFIVVMVLLLLIICLESFFFRILEIRFGRSSSARHLMAKNSIKRSIIIAIITGLGAVLLTVPPVIGALESSANDTYSMSANTASPGFYSSDPFAMTHVVRVEARSSLPMQLYLVDDKSFQEFGNDLSKLQFFMYNKDNYVSTTKDNITWTLTVDVPQIGFLKYRIVLNDLGEGMLTDAEVVREVSETISTTGGLLLIAFVVANIAWTAYLMPIERKYSSGSIYR